MRVLDVARPPPISPLLQSSCYSKPRGGYTEISLEGDEGLLSRTNWESEGPPQRKGQTGWPWLGK